MAYTPYYAPYYRPMNYYNPAIPNDAVNMANVQNQQPIQQTQPMSMVQSAPMPSNDMIWVLNENEATSYPVAPNNSVVLWDKNNPTIYVKSVNSSGMPSMRVLDFVERNADTSNSPINSPKTHECTCWDKFATKEQINALEGKIDDLTAKYEELSRPVVEKPKTTTKKSKESEE